jgi:hypothetical protein
MSPAGDCHLQRTAQCGVGACETDFIRKEREKEAKLVEPMLGLTQTEPIFDLKIAKALGLTILLLLPPTG